MSGCIEVQGIHNIVIACDGILGSLVHTLRPLGRTNQYNGILVVLTDNRDDLLGVALHILPGGAAVGLVADLVDHIVVVLIFLAHQLEEILGLGKVLVGILILQHMPVDDHVQIIVGGILHTAIDDILQILLVAVGTIPLILMGVHRQTDHIHVPVISKLSEGILVHIGRKPPDAVGADASKLYRSALFIHQLRALDGQLSADRGCGELGQILFTGLTALRKILLCGLTALQSLLRRFRSLFG